ncbi:MAG: hypothetical protein QNJ44_22925 [Rhodobacter sp.]|nr:hypothetical protein [Rhodobacter sp.]
MALLQSNFGTKGNFEAVVKEGGQLVHYWRDNDDRGVFPWYRSVAFASDADSEPAFLQGNFGIRGNFEVVAREGSKLRHYWRNNDAPGFPWHKGALFGGNVSSAPALIQSNYGATGNFEIVVREGSKLRHYWRNNDAPGFPWHKGALFGDNVSSAPALLQSNYGYIGNFELVVREGSKLRHYWRNNDAPGYPWNKGELFGSGVSSAPALIQSNFGHYGNFEVMVREGDKLRHYWRDNQATGYPWHQSALCSDHINSDPSLIQGNFGRKGNFELLVMRGDCLTHFWRDNQATGYPWHEVYFHSVPPIGAPPTAQQRNKFVGAFPNLRNFHVTAPSSGQYNCISWSVGVTTDWLWPGYTVADFDAFYASYGWTPTSNGTREFKKRKVALWAMNGDPNDCTHGSRETIDCDWHESKCGGWERIVHDKRQMEDGAYGVIIKYYQKADPSANLDLA